MTAVGASTSSLPHAVCMSVQLQTFLFSHVGRVTVDSVPPWCLSAGIAEANVAGLADAFPVAVAEQSQAPSPDLCHRARCVCPHMAAVVSRGVGVHVAQCSPPSPWLQLLHVERRHRAVVCGGVHVQRYAPPVLNCAHHARPLNTCLPCPCLQHLPRTTRSHPTARAVCWSSCAHVPVASHGWHVRTAHTTMPPCRRGMRLSTLPAQASTASQRD